MLSTIHLHAQKQDFLYAAPSLQLVDVDALMNIYLVDGSNRIIKLDSSGHELFQATFRNLGRIESIDVDNPFKVLVYYADNQTALILDNTLAEIQRIRFTDWHFEDVTACCLSTDNSIWLFDGIDRRIKKCDQSGNVLLASDPFSILGVDITRPHALIDDGQEIIVREDALEATFNDFGVYQDSRIIHLALGFPSSIPYGNKILFYNQDGIWIATEK